MKIRVLPEARQDLRRLQGFLLSRNPLAAEKAMMAIKSGFLRLQENPRLGIVMEERPTDRQLFIPFGNSAYILRYRLDEEQERLFVVRIWHGREERR
ncbi:type II toxin-antitoxin system RelE/ParE family toxin [Rhizobium sp. C1]|uniref:type II toxin-antitoxin system RelE/ParE family toxin n=1 Tax=Rhizobium sp. C1 TaxID=1349799 RepID=UPI001E3CBFFE|nr:type II toxin-antitoxin system RelE/ParE family toxin [Rhizobium sp. C1]MCD2176279.1 type II toxin-antitoxin system RelE/ParE family toxin [Rhizobium sp. C1]